MEAEPKRALESLGLVPQSSCSKQVPKGAVDATKVTGTGQGQGSKRRSETDRAGRDCQYPTPLPVKSRAASVFSRLGFHITCHGGIKKAKAEGKKQVMMTKQGSDNCRL